MEGNNEKREKITLSLNGRLIRKAKHEAVDKKTDVSTLVEEALERFFSKASRQA